MRLITEGVHHPIYNTDLVAKPSGSSHLQEVSRQPQKPSQARAARSHLVGGTGEDGKVAARCAAAAGTCRLGGGADGWRYASGACGIGIDGAAGDDGGDGRRGDRDGDDGCDGAGINGGGAGRRAARDGGAGRGDAGGWGAGNGRGCDDGRGGDVDRGGWDGRNGGAGCAARMLAGWFEGCMSREGVPGGAVHNGGGHKRAGDGARAVGDCQGGGLKNHVC